MSDKTRSEDLWVGFIAYRDGSTEPQRRSAEGKPNHKPQKADPHQVTRNATACPRDPPDGNLFLCMSRNEDGRVERPAEQLISQLTQAKRAVSKTPTEPREAREPKEAQRKGSQRGRGSSAGKAGRNTADQPTRRGIKGDPRGGSHPHR